MYIVAIYVARVEINIAYKVIVTYYFVAQSLGEVSKQLY